MRKAAGILVIHGNKCLLCKRNTNGSLPGEWSIPAGKVEKGENPKEGAVREFFEETNVHVNTPLYFNGVFKRFDREGQKPKGLMYVFSTKTPEPIRPDLDNAKDGEEHTECNYFLFDELPEPMNEPFKTFISNLLK